MVSNGIERLSGLLESSSDETVLWLFERQMYRVLPLVTHCPRVPSWVDLQKRMILVFRACIVGSILRRNPESFAPEWAEQIRSASEWLSGNAFGLSETSNTTFENEHLSPAFGRVGMAAMLPSILILGRTHPEDNLDNIRGNLTRPGLDAEIENALRAATELDLEGTEIGSNAKLWPLGPRLRMPDVERMVGDALVDSEHMSFWREWYQGFLHGKPLDWELQKEIALIPDAEWNKGPERIAELIEELRKKYDRKPTQAHEPVEEPAEIREAARKAIAQRVTINREALAISITGVLEQISEFREKVRGANALDPEYRQSLLDFLDRLSSQLERLLSKLPEQGEQVSEEKARWYSAWWQRFHPLATKKAIAYIEPENVAEFSVPAGIILGCTGVGAMVAGPAGAAAGGWVGNLITGHIKPNKAVEELMKHREPPSSGDGGQGSGG